MIIPQKAFLFELVPVIRYTGSTMKVYLAQPRGFCAGVDRAIDVVNLSIDLWGAPIYVKHAIVHNTHVVNALSKRGAIFVETVEEIPKGSKVVFSAHGSPPEDYEKARMRELDIIDATCPLVTKVHLEARRYAREGYEILLVGHHNHIEMRGTMGEAPSVTTLIETKAELGQFQPKSDRLAILSQTTLSVDDTKEIMAAIKGRFPDALFPPSTDICYATTNRQAAIKELAKKAELILVIGSKPSSNSNRLVDVARSAGAKAYLIEDAAHIEPSWFKGVKTVGVSSGASAPEALVEEVIQTLRQKYGAESVETVAALDESVFFDMPHQLKQRAAAIKPDHPLLNKHAISQGTAMKVR